MTWVTPRAATQMIGKRKLAALTTEANQQELVGTGDGTTKIFPTPFYFVADLKVYADAVLVASGVTLSIASSGQVFATFAVAPSDKAVLTASSIDAVNGANLDFAFLRAQADVRGMVDAALYATPADDAASVPVDLLGWAAAIAWYYLITDPRRPGLAKAYPELVEAYDKAYGGIDSDLKRVAKGTRSLRGVLTYRGAVDPFPSAPIGTTQIESEFSSRERTYGGGRGVF